MQDMDAVMRGLGRMMKSDVKLNWGPGRHTLGDNVFSYFNAPSGNVYEYTAEVEHIPDDWTPRVLPRRADIIDQWETGRIAAPAVYPQLEPDPALWNSDPL
jgi:2,3-dihydroxy-p-cumate/2,3-dihydroxybenzoate 3,4-dioxygenase